MDHYTVGGLKIASDHFVYSCQQDFVLRLSSSFLLGQLLAGLLKQIFLLSCGGEF